MKPIPENQMINRHGNIFIDCWKHLERQIDGEHDKIGETIFH